ncbi:MAG: class I SAM-dependent methyltransferase [Nitrospirae bacterium]|nr:class I SAM-dependent methyltransferase [Nitrospirota bacterium]
MTGISWEDAVRWYRNQPDNDLAIRQNYFDLPVRRAAARYADGEEFAEIRRLLGPGAGRAVLDLGAGQGVSAYALARDGWRVTALEPDPSGEVGAGAIRGLQAETGLPIEVVQEWGERLPFADAVFDCVHGRQVLHHANDLGRMVAEVFRVLKPGGHALFTREHVVDDARQLAVFLKNHPLQHLYGGEHAYPEAAYLATFEKAGFALSDCWGPFDTVINFYPGTEAERLRRIEDRLNRRWFGLGRWLRRGPADRARCMAAWRRDFRVPGRLYTFWMVKPCAS